MEINGTNIQGIWQKCKVILADDLAYYSLLICFISLISFGLGRWSVDVPTQIALVAATEPKNAPQRGVVQRSQAVETRASAATSTIYVGSVNSDKYHLPWCPGAQQISDENKVTWNSKEEAEAAGYVPAGNCKGL